MAKFPDQISFREIQHHQVNQFTGFLRKKQISFPCREWKLSIFTRGRKIPYPCQKMMEKNFPWIFFSKTMENSFPSFFYSWKRSFPSFFYSRKRSFPSFFQYFSNFFRFFYNFTSRSPILMIFTFLKMAL